MKRIILICTLLGMLTGCVTMSPEAFMVSKDQIGRRDIETRKFNGIKEELLLSASANVLQDLGYNLDNSETKLGFISASKERDAANTGQIVGAVLIAMFGGGQAVIDKDQKIKVSLVIRPQYDTKDSKANESYFVRVTFMRLVRRTDGTSYAETLKDEELYQGFFDKLSKSVFIEGQKL